MSNSVRSVFHVAVAALLLVVTSGAGARAQTLFLKGQTIQPVFEGWEKNADGTFSMLFGYMNRNYQETPYIPVGQNNVFSPGPEDRGQPTHFYTRRQSFVFRVTVPADWGQKDLVWTVNHNGKAFTAIASLMPHWVLDEGVWRANLGAGIQVIFKRNLNALIARSHTIDRNGRPASADPIVRQKLAQAYLELEILRLNTNRALTALSKTRVPGAEGSIQKIYWSEMNQRMQQTAQEVLGPYGQLLDFDNGIWQYAYLRSRGNTIEAGTSEIQRNIVAERVLGLPKSY